ncbi:MAG: type II toxin-antitoxin system VapC family toxin [Candidatus Limnocylindria bacterium]
MTALVLDAWAALTLLRGDSGAGEVHRLLRDQALAAEPILVPALFWLEIVNVLAHRYRYPPDAIVEAVYELEQAGVATAEVGRPGVLAVIDGIGRSGLTAYDAAYLVLAESSDAQLLTADVQLASAAGDRAILVGGGSGVAENPAPYAAVGSWASWKGASGYLAELRRAL